MLSPAAEQPIAADINWQPGAARLFPGDSEVALRCREIDWSTTSLGPTDRWSPALRTAVAMALESPFPINLWCGRDLVLIYNDAYRAVLGSKHPRALGHPGAEVWAEIWTEIQPLFDAIRAGKPAAYAENARFLMDRRGDVADFAWFTFALSPIRDEQGAIVAFLNVATETTSSVNAEREAHDARASDVTAAVLARRDVEHLLGQSERAREDAEESEKRYRFMANSIPVQVWTALPDGELDFVSQRSADYFDKAQEEVTGAQWLTLIHADDVAPTIKRWSHSLQSGEPYETEFRVWSAEAKAYRWHLARATAQRDVDGQIQRWFGSNTDIEEQKQNEAKLAELTREATEANRAKSDFLAAMSHELRTPLNAIGGYAQLIEMGLRGPVTEEQKIDLAKIQRSKNHLEKLVSDVLNFAKLGSGRIEFLPQELSVHELVDSVLDMVKPQSDSKNLRIKTTIPSDDLTILADGNRAKQILLNLFANALKFTPSGGTVSVLVSKSDTEVFLEVADTGIGVDEEYIERIFEPFVQADRAIDSRDEGVGLGLAISRQLARAMSGDLTVRSKLGEGSTFTLTLPRS